MISTEGFDVASSISSAGSPPTISETFATFAPLSHDNEDINFPADTPIDVVRTIESFQPTVRPKSPPITATSSPCLANDPMLSSKPTAVSSPPYPTVSAGFNVVPGMPQFAATPATTMPQFAPPLSVPPNGAPGFDVNSMLWALAAPGLMGQMPTLPFALPFPGVASFPPNTPSSRVAKPVDRTGAEKAAVGPSGAKYVPYDVKASRKAAEDRSRRRLKENFDELAMVLPSLAGKTKVPQRQVIAEALEYTIEARALEDRLRKEREEAMETLKNLIEVNKALSAELKLPQLCSVEIIDSNHTYIYCDPSFFLFMKMSQDDVYGRQVHAVVDFEPAEHIQKEIKSLVCNGKTWEGLRLGRRADGQFFLCHATITTSCLPNKDYQFVITRKGMRVLSDHQYKELAAVYTKAMGSVKSEGRVLAGICDEEETSGK
eukprot:Colp12_sorted_trinity150504_noHs@20799